MQTQDLIFANVVGTNGKTRQQKVVSLRFNGEGVAVDTEGKPTGEPALKGLVTGGASAPVFPVDEYAKAQASGNKEAVKAVLMAHAEQVEAWEKSQGGGSAELQLAKAIQGYCVDNHGFLSADGDGFVLKLENLDVKVDALPDGRSMFLVQGTAVFGWESILRRLPVVA